MWQITMFNTSIRDFVTSDRSVMLFTTKEAAEAYIASSSEKHPGRFYYRLTKTDAPLREQ